MSGEKVKLYSMREVSSHNNRDSVWIVINNNVYDVTKFLVEHPGGEEVLIEMAGKNATDNFEDVGHSTDARELMKQYEIGTLCEEDRVQNKKETTEDKDQVASNSWIMWVMVPAAVLCMALAVMYVMKRSCKN